MAAVLLLVGAPLGARGDGAVDLLPNLKPLSPAQVAVSLCYPVEVVEDGARECLRYDGIVANTGAGPFEVRVQAHDVAGGQRLLQRVYRSDGTWSDRDGGDYDFHAAHAHFHYKAFTQTKLWRSDSTGAKLGTAPLAVGRKNGFCLSDVEQQDPDARPAYYNMLNCDVPTTSPSSVEVIQGISPGWADVYALNIEGQYVDISTVPDGWYLLETTADPNGAIVEESVADNIAFTLIRLCGSIAERADTNIPQCNPGGGPES